MDGNRYDNQNENRLADQIMDGVFPCLNTGRDNIVPVILNIPPSNEKAFKMFLKRTSAEIQREELIRLSSDKAVISYSINEEGDDLEKLRWMLNEATVYTNEFCGIIAVSVDTGHIKQGILRRLRNILERYEGTSFIIIKCGDDQISIMKELFNGYVYVLKFIEAPSVRELKAYVVSELINEDMDESACDKPVEEALSVLEAWKNAPLGYDDAEQLITDIRRFAAINGEGKVDSFLFHHFNETLNVELKHRHGIGTQKMGFI